VEGRSIQDHNIAMMENGVKSESITILGKEEKDKERKRNVLNPYSL
jgi:hypothetical protein